MVVTSVFPIIYNQQLTESLLFHFACLAARGWQAVEYVMSVSLNIDCVWVTFAAAQQSNSSFELRKHVR